MSTTPQHAMTPEHLMKAMGSKKGFDPMPPDQHQWQQAEGEPPLLRLWSWMCAHTIRQGFRSPYAVQSTGKPATLKHAAADLEMDLPQASKVWALGVDKGLWHRKDGRMLYLNGAVTLADVVRANAKRKDTGTGNLAPAILLKIREWPTERQGAFFAVWKPAQEFRAKLAAAAIAQARETCDGIEDTILRDFKLQKKRMEREARPPVEVPQMLLPFVQTIGPALAVQITPVAGTGGEAGGENVSVQLENSGASLLGSETDKEELLESVGHSEQQPEPARPTDSPARQLAKILEDELSFLNEEPGRDLFPLILKALGDAPLPWLRTEIRKTAERDRGAKFRKIGLRLLPKLAEAVANAWRKGAAARHAEEKRLEEHRAHQEQQAAQIARDTLDDPRSSEQDKKLAREILGQQTKGATP